MQIYDNMFIYSNISRKYVLSSILTSKEDPPSAFGHSSKKGNHLGILATPPEEIGVMNTTLRYRGA